MAPLHLDLLLGAGAGKGVELGMAAGEGCEAVSVLERGVGDGAPRLQRGASQSGVPELW